MTFNSPFQPKPVCDSLNLNNIWLRPAPGDVGPPAMRWYPSPRGRMRSVGSAHAGAQTSPAAPQSPAAEPNRHSSRCRASGTTLRPSSISSPPGWRRAPCTPTHVGRADARSTRGSRLRRQLEALAVPSAVRHRCEVAIRQIPSARAVAFSTRVAPVKSAGQLRRLKVSRRCAAPPPQPLGEPDSHRPRQTATIQPRFSLTSLAALLTWQKNTRQRK